MLRGHSRPATLRLPSLRPWALVPVVLALTLSSPLAAQSAYDRALECTREADYRCVVRELAVPRSCREMELVLSALRALGDVRRLEWWHRYQRVCGPHASIPIPLDSTRPPDANE
jgi:hypothetical protein